MNIAVDEISWRKRHQHPLFCDHAASKIAWDAPGQDAATLDTFCDASRQTSQSARALPDKDIAKKQQAPAGRGQGTRKTSPTTRVKPSLACAKPAPCGGPTSAR